MFSLRDQLPDVLGICLWLHFGCKNRKNNAYAQKGGGRMKQIIGIK